MGSAANNAGAISQLIMFCIGTNAVLTGWALYLGHNGAILQTSLASIAAVAGAAATYLFMIKRYTPS